MTVSLRNVRGPASLRFTDARPAICQSYSRPLKSKAGARGRGALAKRAITLQGVFPRDRNNCEGRIWPETELAYLSSWRRCAWEAPVLVLQDACAFRRISLVPWPRGLR